MTFRPKPDAYGPLWHAAARGRGDDGRAARLAYSVYPSPGGWTATVRWRLMQATPKRHGGFPSQGDGREPDRDFRGLGDFATRAAAERACRADLAGRA